MYLSSILYYENNVIIISNYLGLLKFKYEIFTMVKYNMNDTKSALSLLDKYVYKSSTMLKWGYRLKYKVIGLGWRCLYSEFNYIYKIGYSHFISFLIPLENKSRKKKFKKEKYLILKGVNLFKYLNLFLIIKNLRMPHIYSKNGIFCRYDDYVFKLGIKVNKRRL